MLKGLRRAVKGQERPGSDGQQHQQHFNNKHGRASKSEIATVTPKKIIRALYDYTARSSDELSFKKEDFLYVVDFSDADWYVACNPLTNSSGLVPTTYFETIEKQEAIATRPITEALHDPAVLGHSRNLSGLSDSMEAVSLRKSHSSSQHSATHHPLHHHQQSFNGNYPVQIVPPRQNNAASGAMFAGFNNSSGSNSKRSSSLNRAIYGIVLYDFQAERADELQAQAGESIIPIAQSNEEWFVAKPIGRLGGPGLIPASYVQLREVGTDIIVEDVQDAIQRAGVPQVEEWKRRAAEYKASSIPLGRFEEASSDAMLAAAVPKEHTRSASQKNNNDSQSLSDTQPQPFNHHSTAPPLTQSSQLTNPSHGGTSWGQQYHSISGADARSSSSAAAQVAAQSSQQSSQQYSSQQDSQTQPLQPHHHQAQHKSQAQQQQQQQQQHQQHQTQQKSYPPQNQQRFQQQTHYGSQTQLHGQAWSNANPTHGNTERQPAEIYAVKASVDKFAVNGGRYWFLLVVKMSNGLYRNMCRYYQDFYDFQIKLLEEFPEEAGRTGKPRTLPFMPGPLTLVNHSISSQRRANLDEYVRNLINMPTHISRSRLVQQLFDLREGDHESDVRSSKMPQPRPMDARGEHEVATDANEQSSQIYGQSESLAQGHSQGQPPVARQPGHEYKSSVSTEAAAGAGATSNFSGPGGSDIVKIKVFHSDEAVALKMPLRAPFAELYAKIVKRLGLLPSQSPQMHVKSDFSDTPVTSEEQYRHALNLSGYKLVLHVKLCTDGSI